MNKIDKYKLAMDILIDRFGEPSWITKPKDGQNRIKIEQDWQDYLDNYSESQIEAACLHIRKWRKVNTFPNLYCLKEELIDKEKEVKEEISEIKPKSEIEIWYEQHIVARESLDYTQRVYVNALNEIIKNFIDETKENIKSFNDGLKLVFNNHKLDDFEEFIHLYAERIGKKKISGNFLGNYDYKKSFVNLFRF